MADRVCRAQSADGGSIGRLRKLNRHRPQTPVGAAKVEVVRKSVRSERLYAGSSPAARTTLQGADRQVLAQDLDIRTSVPPPELAVQIRPAMTRLRRVGVWRVCCRSGLSVVRLFRLAVPHEPGHDAVSTPRSSNRTCRFPASGSDKTHAFARDRSHFSRPRWTSPNCS